MIPSFDSAFEFDAASEQLQEFAKRLSASVPAAETAMLFPSDHEFPEVHPVHGRALYVVEEGALRIREPAGVLLTVEAGECIFAPAAPLSLSTPDFAARVSVYSETECSAGGLYTEIVRFFSDLWLGVTAVVSHKPTEFLPRMRSYEPGQVIIEQGSVAHEVFTLLDGEADVYADGVLVGEIKINEFFGVLAALNGTPRTARVVAKTRASVMCVDRSHFQQLIKARPAIVEKLIIEMGRTIVDLNARVVKLARGEHGAAC